MWCESHSVVSDSLHPHKLYNPWNSPGQNTGVGSGSLLQGIFPTQRSNPGLLHSRKILYQLSHQGSPTKLEWVAYPFSRGYSWPRNQTGVSCTADRFFTNWAIRKALCIISLYLYITSLNFTIKDSTPGKARNFVNLSKESSTFHWEICYKEISLPFWKFS